MNQPAPNTTRRRILQTGTSLGLLSLASRVWAASAPTMSSLEAINQAGRQRMLSQRMAKLYAQFLREIRQPEASKLLNDSIVLFEKQLLALRSFAQLKGTPEIIVTYDQLDARWQDYKKVVGAPPNADGLRQIATLNEQVLASAHAGTVQLEKLHGGSLGKLVNMSGRQRMLSQRISKFYFFRRDGMTTAEITKGLDSARAEFLAAMTTLKQAPENTADINTWIALGETQWVFFDDAVRAGQGVKEEMAYHDNNVAITSENILQVMDKLTNLYTALS